ncbi:MAG: cation transporter, partial [Actinomycetota bacterium]|nr:cation transporter [Actinomycetota bacterium]
MKPTARTAVLDVRPMLRASEQAIIERVLGRQAGVGRVEVNPVAQTATVSYDPARSSLHQLRSTIHACGYHCAGQSVPSHVCDPAAEPDAPRAHDGDHPKGDHRAASELRAPQEVMGHGGDGGMSMASMVADMRNRFLVAIAFAIPIVLWSKIGRDVIGFTVAPPFGLR